MKSLESREEDSKRLDAILESIIERSEKASKEKPSFVLYFPNGYAMGYDPKYKVFQAGSHEVNTTTFTDGREAIDYCLHNDEQEALERAFYESSNNLGEKE